MSEDRSLERPALDLRALTPARVALGRTGASLSTHHALEFALAHARARDAVHAALDVPLLMEGLAARGLAGVAVRSAAADRTEYLLRPDRGRTLGGEALALPAGEVHATRVAILLADGLSALAAQRHALPLLDALLPLLAPAWTVGPVVIAEQARVALGDEIGTRLQADATVMLIGERPGLSSPDSLGAYITWHPRVGCTDAERNCVSNIRAEGLDYATAAGKIAWYLNEGRRLGLSGVAVRENDQPGAIGAGEAPQAVRAKLE